MINRIAPGVRLLMCLLPAICLQQLHAGESAGVKRLFDSDPSLTVAIPKQQSSITASVVASRATGQYLIFNGKVTSSMQHDDATTDNHGLWLNGYPLDTADLPAGVRSVEWYRDRQVLQVILTNGSKLLLSPGERILMKEN